MKKSQSKKYNRFFLQTTGIVFAGQLFSLVLFYGMNILGVQLKFINLDDTSPIFVFSILLLISSVVGVGISFLFAKILTIPLKKLQTATEKISNGDFDVEIEPSQNPVLNDLIEGFNKMAKELKTIETLKSDFISNVSHEFKTPLAVIQSYCKALKRTDLDAETRKKYQTVLENNVTKLTNLTSNILNLSKIENQQMVLDKTDFLLDEQIRQCILSAEPQWSAKNVEFDLNLPQTTYYGSKELMFQVWQNLIDNAIKFSHEGGKISVSVEKDKNGLQVTVSDQGIGMSEETLTRMYDKFYQGDSSRTSNGNGLGLALVKRIVTISGGNINAKSELGKGTTFTVTL